MKINTIRWKTGTNHCGVNADEAFDAIESIRDKHGGQVAPEHLVAAAKAKRHTLHPCFEWDDTKAASEHRVNQARTILRSIEVTYAELPNRPMRSYEIVERKKRGDDKSVTLYKTSSEAMSDPATRDALVAHAIKTAMAFRRRFQGLRELQLIFEAIDKVAEQCVEAPGSSDGKR